MFMKLSVFWTWYVWLVVAACLSELWHNVLCIDKDTNKIENLKKGKIPFYEFWLNELILKNYSIWRLQFSSDWGYWIRFWKIVISTVWTLTSDNKTTIDNVIEVAKLFWENINEYKVFINKSTVPVWTSLIFKDIIKSNLNSDIKFDVISNPEFLREWCAVNDFMNPSRIICWIDSNLGREIIKDLYNPLLKNWIKIFFTDFKSSELIKYWSNSFLAAKISFINELSSFSEIIGANILDVSYWIWLDYRIWKDFLNAWIWYGGSCLSKDVKSLINQWLENNCEFNILQNIELVNIKQRFKVIDKLKKYLDLDSKIISIWWLSYKPWTDDLRDAPSVDIILELIKWWVKKVCIYDPASLDNAKAILKNLWDNIYEKVEFYNSAYDCLLDSNSLLLITEWDEFIKPNFEKMNCLMKENIIIDGRNIWSRTEVESYWFFYEGIGL